MAPASNAPSLHHLPRPALAEAVVERLLEACRDDALDAWLGRHRHIGRWLRRRWLGPIAGAAGDRLGDDPRGARALALLLRWAVARQRPDGRAGFDDIDRDTWLQRTSWRPLLALACQVGFLPLPSFRDRYRARPDEAAVSHLCGLWAIGPSTCYRYLDKGRRAIAQLLREPPGAQDRLSLREATAQALLADLGDDRAAWHARQVDTALAGGDAIGALWHACRAEDAAGAVARVLRLHDVELANEPETELLLASAQVGAATPAARFELLHARSGLARMRGDAAAELALLEQALRVAVQADDALRLGIAYGALGKFHEPRDIDRAFACYQDSADWLRRSGLGDAEEQDGGTPQAIEEYVATLVRLAWLHVLRNDPRATAVLERADALRARHALSPPVIGLLEQTWGECRRRAGDLAGALEHKHRALLLYERLGDVQAVLKTCSNLGLIYAEQRDVPRAIAWAQRVLAMAEGLHVDPEIVASTLLNLGVAHFWGGDYDAAAEAYEQALQQARRAGLPRVARRAHYNLAEVHYLRARRSGAAEDEARGDAHAAAALETGADNDPAHVAATQNLKREILGPGAERAYDRFLPEEFAAHRGALEAVQRQRQQLALPLAPAQQLTAHLAIAEAYLGIALQERDAAQAVARRHGLLDDYRAGDDRLRERFARDQGREQQLAARWCDGAGDVVDAARAGRLVAELLAHGALTKSRYAELAEVSPATASKHLVTLAARGLLAQTGRGPATRYTLPDPTP